MQTTKERKTVSDAYMNKLKNRLYGCLCEFEKGGTWEEALDSILIELMGFPEERRTIDYYIVFHRVSTLRYLSYKYFRKTVFDIMSMLSRLEV